MACYTDIYTYIIFVRKMKTTFLLFFCLLAIGATGQSDSVFHLTVKRSIWFYPKVVSLKRFTLAPGSQISFVNEYPSDYYPAVFERQKGYVEASQIADEFQMPDIFKVQNEVKRDSSLKWESANVIGSDPMHKDWIYCEIVGMGKILSNKLNVIIDYGQNNRWGRDNRIVGDDGKAMNFNSMVDAMNFLGNLGWEFVQAYVVSMPDPLGGTQHVYRWLLKIRASEDEKGILIPITKYERRQAMKN